ncbi:hypothetical protein ACCO45_000693 [Purpureocillium lilacinum]|uniref:Uncharacterized protein n=1 Tax=Purpureocillium lilacinum TaxID=33203 RepID=A0ACC4E7H6_PURLI
MVARAGQMGSPSYEHLGGRHPTQCGQICGLVGAPLWRLRRMVLVHKGKHEAQNKAPAAAWSRAIGCLAGRREATTWAKQARAPSMASGAILQLRRQSWRSSARAWPCIGRSGQVLSRRGFAAPLAPRVSRDKVARPRDKPPMSTAGSPLPVPRRANGSPRIHAIELMARRRAEIMLNCRSPTKRAYWRSSFVRQWWLCEDRRNHWEIWLPRRLRPAQVLGVLMMILTEGGCAGRARVTRGGCTETQRPTRCQGHTTGDLRRAKGHGSSGATAMHLRDGASASLNAFGAVTLLLEAIGKGGELGGLSRADHGCFGDAALTQTDPCCAATRSTVPTGLLALARGEK